MSHKARKRFGQNFLTDSFYQSQIVQSLNLTPEDHLVEIGPGQGAITDHLIGKTSALDLIEIDRDLVSLLGERYKLDSNINIHSVDALKFDFMQLKKEKKLRLIGNLPYNISTPLIFHFISQINCLQDAHFLLQKEVVDRLAASPGCKAYGRISVIVQQAFEVASLFDIPPSAFRPEPKVNSSYVKLTPHKTKIVDISDLENFTNIVKQAFVQKRKTLRNNLKGIISDEQLKSIDIDPGCRAETLSLSKFALISNLCSGKAGRNK
jgi:16S rRNA (adenine1518-N6/adenine1519-N6)-dimethyltransferase